jgi:hypothetical protein
MSSTNGLMEGKPTDGISPPKKKKTRYRINKQYGQANMVETGSWREEHLIVKSRKKKRGEE